MANSALTAANEFGFAASPVTDGDDPTEPATPLATITRISSVGSRWYQHPSVVLGVVVIGTGVAIAHASQPLARVHVEGKAGPAKGSVEGEI